MSRTFLLIGPGLFPVEHSPIDRQNRKRGVLFPVEHSSAEAKHRATDRSPTDPPPADCSRERFDSRRARQKIVPRGTLAAARQRSHPPTRDQLCARQLTSPATDKKLFPVEHRPTTRKQKKYPRLFRGYFFQLRKRGQNTIVHQPCVSSARPYWISCSRL